MFHGGIVKVNSTEADKERRYLALEIAGAPGPSHRQSPNHSLLHAEAIRPPEGAARLFVSSELIISLGSAAAHLTSIDGASADSGKREADHT